MAFQGWTYAIDFPATYTRDKKWNSCVRRRRWLRYRRYKSRDTWAKVAEPACGRGRVRARTAAPLLGGSRGPLLLPSPPVHRGEGGRGGPTPVLGPLTCLLGAPWHCMSLHLGDCHLGTQTGEHGTRPDPGLRLPCATLRLRPCTSASVSPVGATLAPMTMTQTGLGSRVALHEREAPGPCQIRLPAPPAGSSREGTAWIARVPDSLHSRATPYGGPSSRWGWSGPVRSPQSAQPGPSVPEQLLPLGDSSSGLVAVRGRAGDREPRAGSPLS